MPAVPAIIMGGAAIGSSLIGKKASDNAAKAAAQRSPEEIAALNAQTANTQQQTRQSSQLFGAAMPQVGNTLRYYQTLLGGGRGARVAATSPEAESTAEAYQGADLALQRGNVRGGELVQQRAENARAKAGQIARLVTGARPQAASALAGMSSGLVNAAQGGLASANASNASMLAAGQQNRQQANYLGMQTGSNLTGNLGKLFANIYSSTRGGGSKMLSGGIPAAGPGPNTFIDDSGDTGDQF